jgi:hypothetical protein
MNDFAETAELKNAVRKVQVPLRFSQIYCKTNEIIKDRKVLIVRSY